MKIACARILGNNFHGRSSGCVADGWEDRACSLNTLKIWGEDCDDVIKLEVVSNQWHARNNPQVEAKGPS